jgi:hypothetical protein
VQPWDDPFAMSKPQGESSIFLRASRDIETVKRQGRRISTALFNLLMYRMDDAPSRVGIIVGKRFGNAGFSCVGETAAPGLDSRPSPSGIPETGSAGADARRPDPNVGDVIAASSSDSTKGGLICGSCVSGSFTGTAL